MSLNRVMLTKGPSRAIQLPARAMPAGSPRFNGNRPLSTAQPILPKWIRPSVLSVLMLLLGAGIAQFRSPKSNQTNAPGVTTIEASQTSGNNYAMRFIRHYSRGGIRTQSFQPGLLNTRFVWREVSPELQLELQRKAPTSPPQSPAETSVPSDDGKPLEDTAADFKKQAAAALETCYAEQVGPQLDAIIAQMGGAGAPSMEAHGFPFEKLGPAFNEQMGQAVLKTVSIHGVDYEIVCTAAADMSDQKPVQALNTPLEMAKKIAVP